MIARIRGRKIGKATTCPVKVATIDNDATNRRAMPAQKFGGAMDDNVGPMLKGPTEIGRGKGVVDHDRDVVGFGNGRDFCERKDKDIGVAQRFAIDDLGIGANGFLKIFRITRIDKGDINAKAREGVMELIIGATVQTAAADNVIAAPHKVRIAIACAA